MTEAVVDAEVVEDEKAAELVPVTEQGLAVTPSVTADDLVARLAVIRTAAEDAMKVDVDYGKVPGTDKDCLLKPGAEKLSVLFQLDVQIENEKEWGPGDHLTVISRATAYFAPTGARLGYGEGICSTREKKYAYRTANLKCPNCGKETVLRSKQPPRDNPSAEPGWFCWAKKGGCGANFDAHAEQITGQRRGQVENPDLPDLWNVVVKMAEKRARVDVVLAVTGASALFTQDLEEQTFSPPEEARQEPKQEPTPSQRLQALVVRRELPGGEVEALRRWVTTANGELDPDRVAMAIKYLKDGAVEQLFREVNG